MIRGTSVEVLRPKTGSVDEFNAPIVVWEREEVENVLVSPSSSADLGDGIRPDGDLIVLTLHFPKTYEASLRSCRIRVEQKIYEVVGDPKPYMLENTPTAWNRPVSVKAVEG